MSFCIFRCSVAGFCMFYWKVTAPTTESSLFLSLFGATLAQQTIRDMEILFMNTINIIYDIDLVNNDDRFVDIYLNRRLLAFGDAIEELNRR